ncbi:hypothetical protein FSP39_012067 [Pinctada imbricata]|uniref:Uncharacterized protein n=1 Tax=Pinctada imbricata TaxID=66713 RepID=A0AA89C180_PINIB|nr:hypothetical protein FSP39_012067 [Pinctada imbricata]
MKLGRSVVFRPDPSTGGATTGKALAQQAPSQECPSDIRAMIAPPKMTCTSMCPDNLLCCPCTTSGSNYCVYPAGTDEEMIKRRWDEHFQSMGLEKDEDDDCDDDDDDDMEHHDDDKEEGDHPHHHPHHKKGGDKHHKESVAMTNITTEERYTRSLEGQWGLVLLVTIVVTVTCLVRRRRLRMRNMERKRSYIQSNIVNGDKAPLPPNMASAPELTKEEMKATLGTDFTPSV